MTVRSCVLWTILAGFACSPAPGSSSSSSSSAVHVADADASSGPLWADFAVRACPNFDPALPGCRGVVPLTIGFTPLGPVRVADPVWSFGDGSPEERSAAPVHPYAKPGTYTVTLSATGIAPVVKEGYVVVAPAAAGAACTTKAQCQAGLDCRCAEGCPGVAGFCAATCAPGCAAGTSCVATGPVAGLVCLPTCQADADCPTGRCRELLAADGSSWKRVCLAGDVPADDGNSCSAADGSAAPSGCASGQCAPLGARGLCAAACDGNHRCPAHAVCATFTNGDRRCLARCDAAHPCDGDPWLACEVPNGTGVLGFQAAEMVALCAPKRCAASVECGLEGSCRALGGASFCQSK